MSLTTEFFIAKPEDVTGLAATEAGYEEFPRIDAKTTDTIKLAALEQILTEADPEKVYELTQENFRWLGASEEPEEDEEEEYRVPPIMLYLVSPDLAEALAALPPDQFRRYAILWADTEEWQYNNATPADLVPLLKDLSELASCALKEDKNMYLRVAF